METVRTPKSSDLFVRLLKNLLILTLVIADLFTSFLLLPHQSFQGNIPADKEMTPHVAGATD